jgi:2-methylaconitate cis-trans-isomerase PrpF
MIARRSNQLGIPLTIMRGGTSKGLYFHDADLPAPGPTRDAVLLRLMGSPDVLQIDGLGGSRPITSKVAIVASSSRPDADIDYTFAQVDIERAAVHWTGNCGNISSGVGPFAIDEGLVEVHERMTVVRIYNTNTGKILVAHVPVVDGAHAVEGALAIPGVPGTGAEIVLDWSATVGARTGRLLPTGRPSDTMKLSDGRTVEVTVCDVGNPAVWISAAAVGASGSELTDEVNADEALRQVLREVRGRGAVLIGFCDDWRHADADSPALPVVGMVAPPSTYTTMSGEKAEDAEMDLRVRLMFMDRLHESLAGTASVNLAAASRISGSVVAAAIASPPDGLLRAGHPSGVMPIRVVLADHSGQEEPVFAVLGMSRTARRLADCTAYVPREFPNSPDDD